jgi:RHS repeat-associated protein
VAQSRYLPYGQERWTDGPAQTDFTYTGQRAERGFGLSDYAARYYDPYLNRFISADTIVPQASNPQNLNRYSYVNNNPLLYVDPTGHQGGPWDWLQEQFKKLQEWLRLPDPCSGMVGECWGRSVPLQPPSAGETVKKVTEHLRSQYVGAEPPISPEDVERLSQFVEAFQSVEGGVSSWNEFEHAAQGSFTGEDAGKASFGWEQYKTANQSEDILVIGKQPDARPWASQPGHSILDIDPNEWGRPVNDAWVQGGIDRGATFQLASPPTEENFWDKEENRPTIFAREFKQLQLAGYRLSDDGTYMLPPQ